jgi:hypothetical protein
MQAQIACRYSVRPDVSEVITVPSSRHLAD